MFNILKTISIKIQTLNLKPIALWSRCIHIKNQREYMIFPRHVEVPSPEYHRYDLGCVSGLLLVGIF